MATDSTPHPASNQFREYAADIVEQSKEVFLKDKSHSEMFFFINPQGESAVMPAPQDMERDAMATKLREFIHQHHIFGLIHILESWTYFPKGDNDHTMKQIMLGEIAVSNLTAQDRNEALIVVAEARDGYRQMWMTPIKRDGDKLSLGSTIDFDEPPQGRFGNLFEQE
jgi:hypothetical protein